MTPHAEQADRFDQLLAALVNQSIAQREYTELCDLMRGHHERRQQYLAHMILDADLRWDHADLATAADHDAGFTDQPHPSPMMSEANRRAPKKFRVSSFGFRVSTLALAATILLALTAWFALPDFSNPQSEIQNPQSFASVATLTSTANAEFVDTAAPMNLGGSLPAGPIHLTSGSAQLMFASTATVDLTGPCEFEITGPNRGRLTSGSLEADVPPQAKGFTVDLPDGSRIVDLGTRFEVRVDPAEVAIVSVLDGRVAVLGPPLNRFSEPARSIHVTAGQSVRVSQGVARTLHRTDFDLAGALIEAGGDPNGLAGGFNPATGQRTGPLPHNVRNETHLSDGAYHPVPSDPLVDGVFIPSDRGGSLTVSSTGHRFDGPVRTDGRTHGLLWAADPTRLPWPNDQENQPKRLIQMHASKGVTFDLQALRAEGRQPVRFRSRVGYGRVKTNKTAKAHVFVLVDGETRFTRRKLSPADPSIGIDIALQPSDRFLTLMTLDAGSINNDWVMFADPRLTLSKDKVSVDQDLKPFTENSK